MKLSARGRTVLAQVKKVIATPEDQRVAERITHYALLSDRTLAKKDQVRWGPESASGRYGAQLHDWGWHAVGKVKEGAELLNPAVFVARHTAKGYEVVK